MLQSIRTRFIAFFAALVLAPIAVLSAVSVWESRRLAGNSLAEYEKSLTARSQTEMLSSLRELARLQDRTFSGIERRAQALAAQSDLLFQSREACERSGRWKPERLKPGGYGFINAKTDPSSIWVPKSVAPEEAQRNLAVLAHVESMLLAEPRGEGMTQWYVIHRSGVSILVPPAPDIPSEENFDPRNNVFYVPATPANNPGGKIVWTDAYNDPAGRGVMISCLAPIGRGAGFEGVIGIDVNTRDFRAEVVTAGGEWEYAFLLDGRGAVMLVTPEGYQDFGVRAPAQNLPESVNWRVDRIAERELKEECSTMAATPEGLSRIQIGGRDRILAHRRLESTGWILGVVANPAAFLQPAAAMRSTQEALHRRYLATLLASLGILLLSCALFAWFLTRAVTRPLLGLAVAARAIGAGHPETLIGPGGPDEIGTLADTLRQMVHDREEAQRAMSEAQKLAALGGMASGICHELNNLLAPILGFAQVLGRGPLTAEQRAQVDRVERAARAAREVVGSLLDSTHELAGVRQRTDLNATAHEALLQLEAARAAAGVEVVWDLDPDLQPVMANAALMQRAFFNVANNAIQAMATDRPARARERHLVIRSRVVETGTPVYRAGSDPPRLRGEPGPRIEFVFEDNGPGIPPEHLRRIFDPFFTTKPPGSGTGLGLSVATSCVRAHGGTIWAENRPEGGARLLISLPHQPSGPGASKATTVPPAHAAAPAAGRPRVLVVDDEDSIRILVNHALQDDNDVVTCDGGRRALDLLAAQDFDVVLCDLRLRDVSGRDVYAWIRAHRPALARRFMVITGDTHGDEGKGFLEEFRTPCVTKPFDLDDLRARVNELLSEAKRKS